ncbi:hypothetical protein GOP47_0007170 [Adiantum capillus-veneris]|uniref:Uncharacterized protein n=1 Tax=Adiantum capillus-veneris TaxID=13818 RepID=A0A9D4V0S1_ADICA|nr:hypothetical protein GOP47_0007170 [Adiantum capillus-veneris]
MPRPPPVARRESAMPKTQIESVLIQSYESSMSVGCYQYQDMESGSSASNYRLEGKVAIITGGASGIGEASVRLFVQNGASVVIADVQDEKGLELAKELCSDTVVYKRCDVTQESDVEALVDFAIKKWGKLDIMFNNAGILGKSLTKEVSTMDMDDFDHVMLVNTRGMVLGVKHASKAMLQTKTKGSIICTSSIASISGGLATTAYTISKHAVLGLIRAASSDLGRYGIRVNCISPAGVVTPLVVEFLQKVTSNPSLTPAQAQDACDETSCFVGHSLSALDIAHAALYLASDNAAFVSGLNLVVDGGFTASHQGFKK